MVKTFGQNRFRQPQPKDRMGLLIAAGIMIALIWFGIVPAVMTAAK